MTHTTQDFKKAKENAQPYYLKFKPTLIEPTLIDFLKSI